MADQLDLDRMRRGMPLVRAVQLTAADVYERMAMYLARVAAGEAPTDAMEAEVIAVSDAFDRTLRALVEFNDD